MKGESLPTKSSGLHTAEKCPEDLYISKRRCFICEIVFCANFLPGIGCKSFKFFTIIGEICCGCPASWEVDKSTLINFHAELEC